MDNLLHMPSPLERLADRLRGLLSKDASNRQEWIEIQMGKCLTLAEMRGQFPGNIQFGRWCEANGFGNVVIDRNTRADAIEMGKHPDALRACLEATKRQSLREIYRVEFPRNHSPVITETKPRDNLGSAIAAGILKHCAEHPAGLTDRELATLLGRGHSDAAGWRLRLADCGLIEKAGRRQAHGAKATATVWRITEAGKATLDEPIAIPRSRQPAANPIGAPSPLPPAQMPPTLQQRYEAQLALAKKQMREELKAEVTAEIHTIYDGYIKYQNERITRADRIIAGHKGFMSRAAYRKIKASLHPDHSTFAHAAEALQLFSDLEDVLIKPEEPTIKGAPLPQTAAELMAWRQRRGG